MSPDGARVVHVGIDGGAYRILDALAHRERLPGYERLLSDGGSSVLWSTTPWFTVPAWITWMTGVAAERHGLISWTAGGAHDHWDRSQEAARFVLRTDISFPTVFALASSAGRRVASLNMPVTFPPEQVNGVMVSGFLGPTQPDRVSSPPGFLARYPRYRVDLDGGPDAGTPRIRSDDEVAAYADELSSMTERRHEVLVDLLAERFDLTSAVFVGADRLSHIAWPQVEAVVRGDIHTPGAIAVEQYYRNLDRVLEAVRVASEEALFVVTSDHGQGPPPERLIAPNVLLREAGLLALRSPAVRRAARLVPGAALRRKVWRVWRRLRHIPSGSAAFVDWERSAAYALAMPHCRAFGVAVRGEVAPDEISARLLEVRDPETGERPIREVLVRGDICDGPALESYPDLLALTEDRYGMTASLDGPVFRSNPPGPSGYHEPDGILLAAGPGVGTGRHAPARIADIAPTLLARLGIDPPGHMDGVRVPWIAPARELIALADDAGAVRPGSELSEDDEAAIARHLRELGYVD